MSRLLICLCSLNALVCTSVALAQESQPATISTDRPTISFPQDVIAPHSIQIESGVNVLYSGAGYAVDFPEDTLRIGLGHGIETRLTSANLMRQSDRTCNVIQLQDFSFGLKMALKSHSRWSPQAVFMGLSIPTGGRQFTSGSLDPNPVLIWQQLVRGGFTVIENIGGTWTTLEGSRKMHWSPAFYASHSVFRKASAFAEYAPTLTAGTRPVHIVSGGLAYNPVPARQFDVKAGYQDDLTGRHSVISVGYSVRLDGVRLRP